MFGIKRRDVEGDGGEAVRALLQRRQHRAVTNCVVLHVYTYTLYTSHHCIAASDAARCTCKHVHVVAAAARRGGGAPCGMQSKTAGDRASCGGLPVKEGVCGCPLHLRDFSYRRDVLKFTDDGKERPSVRHALPTIHYFCTKRFR